MSRSRIILKSGKDQSLRRYHPWVFSGAIKKIAGTVREGDLVDVEDNKGTFLGTGHYQPGSIAVRILSFEPVDPDERFWRERLEKAYSLRKETGLTDSDYTNVYRLVFGEGDQLPGLIIDYYNGMAVMQCHSVGMYLQRETFVTLRRRYMVPGCGGCTTRVPAPCLTRAASTPATAGCWEKKKKGR